MKLRLEYIPVGDKKQVQVYSGDRFLGNLWMSHSEFSALDEMLTEGAYYTNHYYLEKPKEDVKTNKT